jgi:hypothetical protein
MSRNPAALWFLAVAIGVSACGRGDPEPAPRAASFPLERIADATILEVLSLDPEPGLPDAEGNASAVKEDPAFHGWPFLGRSTSISREDQAALLKELGAMFADPPEVTIACHLPRHALRLQTPTGDLDVLICFECSNLEIYDAAGIQLVFTAFQGADEELWYEIFERSGITKQLRPYRT